MENKNLENFIWKNKTSLSLKKTQKKSFIRDFKDPSQKTTKEKIYILACQNSNHGPPNLQTDTVPT